MAAVSVISTLSIPRIRSSKSTDIDVPRSTVTDLATDMSGHGVASIPEIEIDDRGVTSIQEHPQRQLCQAYRRFLSLPDSRKVHQQSAMDEEAEWA